MTATVTADLAITLDGYAAGPNVTLDNPGGDGGEPIFDWIHLVKEGGTTFTFVTDGIRSALDQALDQARAAAGGRNADIGGGADPVRQPLAAGLVDEGLGPRRRPGTGQGRRDTPGRPPEVPLREVTGHPMLLAPSRDSRMMSAWPAC
ncbi:hypothetical protein [Streptomyces tendae]|uniref:hypothetical protein n=1 Tax=Streptomyces tendae TaxID=1932 RepID=UPI0036C3DE19